MKITVDVKGLEGLEDALANLGPKLAKRSIRKALAAGGQVFVDGAKQRAPVMAAGTPQREPGELRDAIEMRVTLSSKEESGTARIGLKHAATGQDPGVWGSFVEFGSVHNVPAHPFMRPAFESGKARALEVVIETFRDGVDSLGK